MCNTPTTDTRESTSSSPESQPGLQLRSAAGRWPPGQGHCCCWGWRGLCVCSELKWWLIHENFLPGIPREPACPHGFGESCFLALFGLLLVFGSSFGAPCFSRPSCFFACSMFRPSPPHAWLCVMPLDPKDPSTEANSISMSCWIRPSFSFELFCTALSLPPPWFNAHDHKTPAPSAHTKCSH